MIAILIPRLLQGVMLGVNIQTPGPGGEVNVSPGGASSGPSLPSQY